MHLGCLIEIVDDKLSTNENEDKAERDSENQNNEEFILPESNSRYLTEEDLAGLDLAYLRIARNEIYARHGRRFKDDRLQDYFDSKDWYDGTIDPEMFDDSVLSSIEISNAELIEATENKAQE